MADPICEHWADLPPEMWTHIFTFLDPTSLAYAASLCHLFYDIGAPILPKVRFSTIDASIIAVMCPRILPHIGRIRTTPRDLFISILDRLKGLEELTINCISLPNDESEREAWDALRRAMMRVKCAIIEYKNVSLGAAMLETDVVASSPRLERMVLISNAPGRLERQLELIFLSKIKLRPGFSLVYQPPPTVVNPRPHMSPIRAADVGSEFLTIYWANTVIFEGA